MSDKFPTGAIVYLKSGSPRLTVSDMPGVHAGFVNVEWFVNGMVQRDTFHEDCLTTVASIGYTLPEFGSDIKFYEFSDGAVGVDFEKPSC